MVLTFPGVYHGGFSPTYNICEAVNMAGVDWIEAARKHIEMNSREGYPRKSCFSLEWMIFENMLQVDRLNFSDSTKSKLKAQYKNMVDIELSKRKKIRQTVEEELLFQGGKLKYYELQCNACRTYCYLSCVACRSCYMTACLNCNLGCTCNSKSKVLFVRHTENELVNY